MYPKLVALDTDWTSFRGQLDQKNFDKGRGAAPAIEDNLGAVNERCSGTKGTWWCSAQVLISPFVRCDRALWYFKATTPRTGKKRPIIDGVKFNEVYEDWPFFLDAGRSLPRCPLTPLDSIGLFENTRMWASSDRFNDLSTYQKSILELHQRNGWTGNSSCRMLYPYDQDNHERPLPRSSIMGSRGSRIPA
ncbi:hypothetical protein BDN67DRAFT_981107 [Paxillus ammoniavirescens]|nr:hypothetical protein BDN67DRAFT_981107 [Paxillus ammoniavirescens]